MNETDKFILETVNDESAWIMDEWSYGNAHLLTEKQKENARRWLRNLEYAKTINLTSEFPRTYERIEQYYCAVKQLCGGYFGLARQKEWCRFVANALLPEHLQSGDFDPYDEVSPPEIYWLRFDAALSRWLSDLPRTGLQRSISSKMREQLLSVSRMESSNPEGVCRSITRMLVVAAVPIPLELYVRQYLDLLAENLPDVEARLKKSKRYPYLADYFRERVVLPPEATDTFGHLLEIAHVVCGFDIDELACIAFSTNAALGVTFTPGVN